MKSLRRHLIVVATLALSGCAQPPAATAPEPPDTREADAAAIHAALDSWSAASEAKDAESFVSVYADDAVLMLEGAPDIHGSAALREGIAGMMSDPNFALSFAADNVTVARAGDLAYETGTYSLTMSDAEQNPATQTGHYIVVWEKQADGGWKVIYDVPVSDPPAE